MRVATIILCIATLLIFGCSSDPEKPETAPASLSPPIPAQFNLVASDQVNPDLNGRPSPIVIRVYELKNLGKYEVGDFYQLFENYDAHLGAELVASGEYHINPGEVKKIKRTLSEGTKYVAVAAAYRDINQAIWKDSIRIADEKTIDLLVFIEKLNISIWKK